jgi:nicotinamide-nucleotide amidase
MLGDVTRRGRDPEVGITVHEATITLRIVAHARTIDEAESKIAATKRVIYERMGDYAYGEEDEELEHVVIRQLKQAGRTLSVVEIGTGGLIAHRLTSVDEHRAAFLGGLVLPDIVRSTGGLEFCANAFEEAGPMSSAGAGALARMGREQFGADLTLAVTDCTHRDFQESVAIPPVVFVALTDGETISVRELNVAGDPAILKSRIAKSALNLVRLKLLRG